MEHNLYTARRFIETFNDRDLDGFVATLHADVEIHGNRGTRRGIPDARDWATRAPGGVQQRVILEHVEHAGDRVLALILREWWWDDEPDPELARRDEMAWLFRFEDGLIREWTPFDDRSDEALAAFGGRG